MTSTYTISRNVIGALRGLAPKPARERCELCNVSLSGYHPHLLQASTRAVLCACDACAILFNHRGEDKRFFRIPRDSYQLAGFVISDAEWSALRLPIDLAFFVNNSGPGRVTAYYPSPAGCTESLLDLDAWQDMLRNNPILAGLSPDVEALLVNRTRDRRDYFIAPIDQCYRLTGLIRRHWRGFSGGDDVWREIENFFENLRERAADHREVAHA